MNSLLRIICCFIFLNMLGCTTQLKSVTHSHDVKQCNALCMKRFDACKLQCTDNCAACTASATHTARVHYSEYTHEEQIRGGFIARGLKSYRDPLQCRKVSCSCSTDLMTCTQNCTGIIQKQLNTVPYCP